MLREPRVIPYGHPLHLLHLRSRVFGTAVVRGIFLAVDRCDMRRVPAEIWAPDSELLPLRINPLPQLFGASPSLVARSPLAPPAISPNPLPIATPGAPPLLQPLPRRLRRVKRMKQF